MKQVLIDILSIQNNSLNGSLISQPIDEYVEKILKNATLMTYILEGRIAGFVAYYCNDPLNKLAFLTMLCIDAEYEGKGIGSHLLHCSIADIKGKGFSTYQLEVKEDNHPAIKLYKSAGFEIAGIAIDYLKMKKEISHEG